MNVRTWLVFGALGCRSPEPTDPGHTVPTTPVEPTTPTSTTTNPVGPLGAWFEGDTLRFRVHSHNATRVEAWVYAAPTGNDVVLTLPLTAAGEVWEGEVPRADLEGTVYYGLRAWGPNWPWDAGWVPGSEAGFLSDVDATGNRYDPNKLLLDPYAREISHDPGGDWGVFTTGDRRAEDSGPVVPKGIVLEDDTPPTAGPGRPPQDEVVYEVHVRGFTMLDPNVPADLRGTYAGAALRAAELADLGVTAIELLPVQETGNDQNDLSDDASGDNYWGYSTVAFFAPDRRYAADKSPGGPTREFREMVDAFHAEGLSVWIDVVYNHTAEGGTWGDGGTAPLLSFRGLDNAGFYELGNDPDGYRNDNGVGPNLNATTPIARNLVLDSLHYWEDTLGVDGFRFDLAPILGNGCATGCFSFEPDDPDGILARAADELDAVVVAEPWGATGEAYQGGKFPAGWAEWNDGFRDAVRTDQNLLEDRDQTLRTLVDAMSGSPSRYGDDGRSPWSSVAFVVAHDGFTLADLYSCNGKDNEQDWPYGPSGGGSDDNRSWDQGGDPVDQRRAARTGMALSLLSAGMPMFNGGDELLRSQRCNNNPYNLDSVATWIDWPALEAENAAFRDFTAAMLAFRAAHPALRPATYSPPTVYDTEGNVASDTYLDDPTRHAMALRFDDDLLVLVNGWSGGVTFTLPPSPSGGTWKIFADTHEWLEGQANVFPLGAEGPLPDEHYLLGARSVAVVVD